jgi:sortase A
MRLKNLILILAALATVFVLAACGSSGQSKGDGGNKAKQENAQKPTTKQKPLRQEPPKKQVAPKQGPRKSGGGIAAVKPPSDKMMRLTVPKMKRLKNDKIPTGSGTDERLFHDYAGVHLKYTGYPWQKVANVYIAGHRLGYKNTDSWLAFDDLNKLKKGDKIYITDSEGRKYTYEVSRRFIAKPGNLSVLNPVAGKNIVTLQTCTLPDYVNRFLVRGELKDIEKA